MSAGRLGDPSAVKRAQVVRQKPDAVTVDTAQRRRDQRPCHVCRLLRARAARRQGRRDEAGKAVLRDRDATKSGCAMGLLSKKYNSIY